MPEGNILGQLLFLILVQREKIFRLIVYILEKKVSSAWRVQKHSSL